MRWRSKRNSKSKSTARILTFLEWKGDGTKQYLPSIACEIARGREIIASILRDEVYLPVFAPFLCYFELLVDVSNSALAVLKRVREE